MPREMVSLLLAAVHNDMYEMADGDIMATTYSDVLMCYMLEGHIPPPPPINTLMISRIKIFCFILNSFHIRS